MITAAAWSLMFTALLLCMWVIGDLAKAILSLGHELKAVKSFSTYVNSELSQIRSEMKGIDVVLQAHSNRFELLEKRLEQKAAKSKAEKPSKGGEKVIMREYILVPEPEKPVPNEPKKNGGSPSARNHGADAWKP